MKLILAAFLPLLLQLASTAPAPQASDSPTTSFSLSPTLGSSALYLTITPTGTSTSSSASSSSPSSIGAAATPAVHLVQVGANGFTYTPNFINAAIGDHVVFEFHALNHTLTQSSFESPCFHLTAADGITPIGIDSGFVPVPANATVFPSWVLTVQVATPLWFFCRQSNHCEQGMGFGLNPPTTGNTIEAFIAKAQGITSIPTWNSTATAKWTGSGIAAAFSTGVSQVNSLADAE
ncbi:hypothetical protein RQP46_003061 [Phenoliferia psychrophenolica]